MYIFVYNYQNQEFTELKNEYEICFVFRYKFREISKFAEQNLRVVLKEFAMKKIERIKREIENYIRSISKEDLEFEISEIEKLCTSTITTEQFLSDYNNVIECFNKNEEFMLGFRNDAEFYEAA